MAAANCGIAVAKTIEITFFNPTGLENEDRCHATEAYELVSGQLFGNRVVFQTVFTIFNLGVKFTMNSIILICYNLFQHKPLNAKMSVILVNIFEYKSIKVQRKIQTANITHTK